MRVLRWVATAAFALAGLTAATLGWAETVAWQDTPAALQRAVAIETALLRTPNAGHLERLAEIDAACAHDVLRGVVILDPRRTSAWITLGLLAERDGDWVEAGRDLLQAANVDHQYLPAWTLANFYFRRQDTEAFWKWARQAAGLSYDDRRPLLRLADAFDRDPVRVLARLGDSAPLERGYITFLIGENRLDAAQVVARKLAARHDPSHDVPRQIEPGQIETVPIKPGSIENVDGMQLTDLADRYIRAGQVGPALEFWNALHRPALDPVRGPILSDANFAHAPAGAGFDWRLIGGAGACPGVSGTWNPGQIRFSFSGGQGEDCLLLTQPIPVAAATVYRLDFEYRTEGLAEPSGLRWTLDSARSSALLSSSSQWSASAVTLHSRRFGLALLQLSYHREPGTARREGSAVLRNLQMESQ
jgi:hypothetical protein